MSKYDPLRTFLASSHAREMPLTFAEVERVLGFSLPPYARRGRGWWSNNPGTHVGVKAWHDAGWKTTRVDVPGERVTFVRDEKGAGQPAESSVSGNELLISLDMLTKAARDHLASVQENFGLDQPRAVVAILNGAGRRAVADWFAANAPKTTSNSVDLIREDRDAR